MNALQKLLDTFRNASASEREKGTYLEELVVCYLRNEATYRDLYSDVWTYAQWAALQGLDKRDAGIDLVAKVQGTGDIHTIQCKRYVECPMLAQLLPGGTECTAYRSQNQRQ
jgi:predicted helicase